ncbi:MAG: hypothetical protein RLZZ605_214 [Bacteroidota bacterium]
MNLDSTNLYSIKQSIKCFTEAKSLKVIIQQKDSIIMNIEFYNNQKEIVLKNQRNQALSDRDIAEQKAIKLQNKNYLLTTALVVESIILGLVIIFK